VKHGEGKTNSPELVLLKFLPLVHHQAISWPPHWIRTLLVEQSQSHEKFIIIGTIGDEYILQKPNHQYELHTLTAHPQFVAAATQGEYVT